MSAPPTQPPKANPGAAAQWQPVARIRSPYRDKFGVPRQPGLVPEALATVELLPPYNRPEALRGIDEFSHLWLIFLFDRTAGAGWKPMVRPPRLGGNRRVGVFASRSNFRPNPVGLSVVELVAVDEGRGRLTVAGADLVDATPILDIKPYIPYVDALPEARAGFAPTPPQAVMTVAFTPEAEARCRALEGPERPNLRALIERLLGLDPRPAYHGGGKGGEARGGDVAERRYGMRLYDLDLRWVVEGDRVRVVEL